MQRATHTCQAAELKQSLAALIGVANARDIILEVRSGSTIVSVKFATAIDPSALASAAQARALASPALANARVAQATRESALIDSHGCLSDYCSCAAEPFGAAMGSRRRFGAGATCGCSDAAQGLVANGRGYQIRWCVAARVELRRVCLPLLASLVHTRVKHGCHVSPMQLASASAVRRQRGRCERWRGGDGRGARGRLLARFQRGTVPTARRNTVASREAMAPTL